MILQRFVDRMGRRVISSRYVQRATRKLMSGTGLTEQVRRLSDVTFDVHQKLADMQLHQTLYVDRGTQTTAGSACWWTVILATLQWDVNTTLATRTLLSIPQGSQM
ncbi:MAG: hypothetical protein JO020_02180 [Chloroflexi bacterium]|nr:hypothetical protein [Chloroflexota bacterium]